MDILTREKRSWNMSRIKGKDTKPEKIVRSALHKKGFRFRLNRKDLPGKPDIVLPKYKSVIFVHGCFWHRHPRCKFAYNPKSRETFWQKKFSENVERDRFVKKELRKMEWKVIVVWECELKNVKREKTITRILKALCQN
ncbi:MAG: DNA mismatch endonuclease Vsr [Candidatus Scalindua sp.]|jgi:DNA mismatch endonuclease, patch repair protein|nr:DNA mismatch endonuclease Vsr [Candidatus Scalindua sp.]MBT6227111.1 DNA mismatch endonuclease Vsr [Candidatus Scalindua sp.]MBT6673488.1 DNA mismatch endonuclease Vsr [Lentimicrobiaceae bacterium]